jgi:ferredoxin-NADP reductase
MARAAVLGRLTWRVGTLVSAHRESLTARTLALEVPDWPGHLPGQHVDLRLTAPDGYSTQRSYSIASAWDPTSTRPVVELTVEEVDDGEVSPYLVDVMEIGYPIELRGPVGGWFVWRAEDPPVRTVLAAGGSGLVPLMAMVRARRLAGSRAPFRLVYSVRTPAFEMYADELAELAADGSGFELVRVYTRSAPPAWPGVVGRVRPEQLLSPLAGGRPEAVFVCGPTGFVEAVADTVAASGLDARRIKTERFGPTGG